jgi:hypothetical protein
MSAGAKGESPAVRFSSICGDEPNDARRSEVGD